MILSFDVGSTYCKGALFSVEHSMLKLVTKYAVPTTPRHLPDGVFRLFEGLKLSPEDIGNHEVVWSSSAKGGLGIIALGIVTELTLKMAREAACSAGGRIMDIFNYKLNGDDLRRINSLAPDILLFTGGTDGGNEDIVLHNARLLALLNRDIPVIYAGNRTLRPQIRKMLSGHELHIVENVLPDIENPNPVPARNKIRKIFLERIVAGKGLDEIMLLTGSKPLPTPYSMLEFIKAVNETGYMDNFSVIDLGGATTDFYSACKSEPGAGVIVKGLAEPEVKRSVEGDVGMRVSAASAYKTAQPQIARQLEKHKFKIKDFEGHIEAITANPEVLPETAKEKCFDGMLAAACVAVAAERHAGHRRRVYTVNGMVEVQAGKDISKVKTVIGTGGYLSDSDGVFMREALTGIVSQDENETCLLPQTPFFCFDRNYLFPLLANAAVKYPEEACCSLSGILSKET